MRELLSKRNYIFLVAIVFVAISLSGTTYSLFINVDNTSEFVYRTGILDLEFVEGSSIKLDNAFPVSDTLGMNSDAYTLKIKNIGSLAYIFDIKMMNNDSLNAIDTGYIKISVDDGKPFILKEHNNVLKENIILYPQEEISLNVKIWLDMSTPNSELGKSFQANLITSGSSFYKTLDISGANHPIIQENMIPVFYDDKINKWKVADYANLDKNNQWYDYDSSKWANSVVIRNRNKYIYDVSDNKNNIIVNKLLNISSGNIILNNDVFRINTNVNGHGSIITRFKFNEIELDNEIMSFPGTSIKYSVNKFILNIGGIEYDSMEYKLSNNEFYIMSYVFSDRHISLYLNGDSILDIDINNNTNYSLVNYGEKANITISDIYIYNQLLNDKIINSNFKDNVIVLDDGLVCGYNDFYPMSAVDYYANSAPGIVVDDSDILEFYVWIPRYKYRVWNIMGDSSYSSYDAYNTGVDIEFERYNYSSGTIYCSQNICYSDSDKTVLVTASDNTKYFTHSAFSLLNRELYGFWVSKYEMTTDCNMESCLSNNLDFNILPNGHVWTNNYLSNFYGSIINKGNNYHMIKNTEWGCVAYLSHSKYGACNNGKCNYVIDSTTNNMYGVFNMNGNYSEFVMANYTNNNQLSLINSHFSGVPILNSDYDLYSKNSFILGDATLEVMIDNSSNGSWYNNHSVFIDEIHDWFIRGSNMIDNNSNGMFYYGASSDEASMYITSRVVVR